MKKLAFLVIAIVAFCGTASSQILEPVTWTSEVKKTGDDTYDLIFNATIEDNWHLYTQNIPDGGPIPTTFTFENERKAFELIGKVTESESHSSFDKIFEMELSYFDHAAQFVQKIKVLDASLSSVNAAIDFQSCDDEKCIFENAVVTFQLGADTSGEDQIFEPVKWNSEIKKISDDTYELIFNATIEDKWHVYSTNPYDDSDPTVIGPIPTSLTMEENSNIELVGDLVEVNKPHTSYDKVFEMDLEYFDHSAIFSQKVKVLDPSINTINVGIGYQACDDEKCIYPSEEFLINLKEGKTSVFNADISKEDLEKSAKLKLPLKQNFKIEEDKKEKSFLTIFFLGFIGGLIALLTPCVFPMIPLTVSFFTKSAKNKKLGMRNAILYGIFIFGIYVILSLPFHLLDSLDPEILNNISTNVTLNVIFFVIFIAFAFSFFGYYEITLPQSWSAKMDDKANTVGGVIGIFFMALTLAIVSFSCTGPILGSLLGGSLSSDGGAMQLTMGMGGFGLALALPFALFALFPNWLNTLPKSGGWLNTVKVVLGFVELALAFKFLSNADLVEHWGILLREIFIGIWILCALGLALYLFGFIRFPHDGPKQKKKPIGNIIVGVAAVAFLLYLIPGMTNTKYSNLKLLSGFPPPMFYSLYDRDLGITGHKDFYDGLEEAKKTGKPIMIDFTGWACVNCRKMEEQVWIRDDIYSIINDDYILVSLYVDDRKDLDESEKFKFAKPNGGTKLIKTIGDKWATFQTLNFQNNSQPYYILIDKDFNMLNKPVGYTSDADEYLAWLKEGLSNHKGSISKNDN